MSHPNRQQATSQHKLIALYELSKTAVTISWRTMNFSCFKSFLWMNKSVIIVKMWNIPTRYATSTRETIPRVLDSSMNSSQSEFSLALFSLCMRSCVHVSTCWNKKIQTTLALQTRRKYILIRPWILLKPQREEKQYSHEATRKLTGYCLLGSLDECNSNLNST